VSRRKRAVTAAATVTGTAAALVAGYAAAGAAGLIDVATLATLGVLIGARAAIRGEKPRSVPPKKQDKQRPADFPAYASIASDVEWARMSRRHYEHALRPRLTRLAAALGQPGPPGPAGLPEIAGQTDTDGPGPDLATLDRIVTRLEGP
jgi:hypothetical protein